MNEVQLKQILANNLVKYRKLNNLTQYELAEKLSYSDKAVSKWERGESVPDIFALQAIAALYDITLDDLLSEHEERKPIKATSNIKRLLIAILSAGLVWLVATIIFVFTKMFVPSVEKIWLVYIYSIPASAIVLLVFSEIWHKKKCSFFCCSILIWSVAVAINLTLTLSTAWLIYIIPIPLQILTVLWFMLIRLKNKKAF